jgi:hypothetical protein
MSDKISVKLPHEITKDISKILTENPEVLKIWSTLTPLAQNEWICWVTFFKKEETYQNHLSRLKEDLLKGKRRPCCWIGCPHRIGHPKKPIEPNQNLKKLSKE